MGTETAEKAGLVEAGDCSATNTKRRVKAQAPCLGNPFARMAVGYIFTKQK